MLHPFPDPGLFLHGIAAVNGRWRPLGTRMLSSITGFTAVSCRESQKVFFGFS